MTGIVRRSFRAYSAKIGNRAACLAKMASRSAPVTSVAWTGTVSVLHFYERQGLIQSRRTAGNQRRYPRAMLRRVAFIRVSQRVGIPLAEIRAALDTLPERRSPTREDWEALSARWRQDLDRRIAQLERLRDDLSGCIGCGCLSLDRCALFNPEDTLGEQGPGARLLEVE